MPAIQAVAEGGQLAVEEKVVQEETHLAIGHIARLSVVQVVQVLLQETQT